MVEDEAGGVAEAIVDVSRRLVAAEDAAERAAVPEPPHSPAEASRDETARRGSEREGRPHAPPQQRVETGRGDDHRQEDERLEPGHRGERARGDEQRLPAEGRPLQRSRQREGGEDDGRIEEDLGHDQPRVREPGDREGQQGGDDRPAAGDERARPQIDRNGGQRHHEGLDQLQHVVAALQVGEAERSAGERRIDEAEQLGRVAEDAQLAARPEAPAVLAVDDLVRHHPRRRHEAPAPEAKQRRDTDECGEERDGGRRAAHGPDDGLSSYPRPG